MAEVSNDANWQPNQKATEISTVWQQQSLNSKSPTSIDVLEVQQILLAFQLFAPRWKTHKVSVSTERITAYLGLNQAVSGAHC